MPANLYHQNDEKLKQSIRQLKGAATAASISKKFKFMGELRAHSPSNDSDDDYTNLWSCIFEPEYKGCHPNLAATCGGNTICFVDCATMTVLKKYKHLEEETFITMAWTVLSRNMDQEEIGTTENDRSFSVLAVAGTQGDIKLIEPSMLLCYAYLRGHRSELHSLCFSKIYPRWLLSAGNDHYILLWEIGVPKGEAMQTVNQCLCRFDTLDSSVISLDFNLDSSGFLVGCENSDCQYFEISKEQLSSTEKRKTDCLKSFYGYEDNYHGSNIDCLHIVDKNIVVSKGACDAEFIVWDLTASLLSGIPAALFYIKWEKTDYSFLRSSLRKINENYYLMIGCPDGSISVYILFDDLSKHSTNILEPSLKLKCENSKGRIRHVDISYNGDYIIAVNEKNGVFVWKLIN